MRRRLLVVLLAFLPACETTKEPIQAVAPTPTYAISGTIRDAEGRGLARANADVFGTTVSGRRATSNADGRFTIKGVTGPLVLRVWKEGYEAFDQAMNVSADTVLDVTLARFEYADTLILGRTMRSYVSASARPCDPVRWDAYAPCRMFHFFPPVSGTLTVVVSWRGEPELDVTLVAHEGAYISSSTVLVAETAVLEAVVDRGTLYEIRVNSYYDYQEFDLLAELAPPRVVSNALRRQPQTNVAGK